MSCCRSWQTLSSPPCAIDKRIGDFSLWTTGSRGWSPAQREWVSKQFVEEPAIGLEAAASHLRLIVAEILKSPSASVFLCNVFRHVPGDLAHRYMGAPQSLGERIRRFNLLGAEVSKDTGAYVVDLDWVMANAGASELQTDYRLQGRPAAVAGAAGLVSTMFKAGLDEFFPAEIQVKALAQFEARQRAALEGTARLTVSRCNPHHPCTRRVVAISASIGMLRISGRPAWPCSELRINSRLWPGKALPPSSRCSRR